MENHISFSKKLENIHKQRDATNEYYEVLNMNLNIWLDIPSKYIDSFCVIVSIVAGIFSERLADTSCQDFSLSFFVVFL